MYFFKVILILFLIVHHSWCDETKKKEISKNASANETKPFENNKIATPAQPVKVPVTNICDKCNCTGA